MKVYHSLTEIPTLKKPISLCIGVFDGLHLGHKFLLEKIKEYHGTSVILTFINHPLELLKKDTPPPLLLTTQSEKVQLLAISEIDVAILIPFTREIAEMTYQMFLSEIYIALSFQHLYIGEKDTIGKDRKGTIEALTSFGLENHFQVHSIPKLTKENRTISTSWIRESLRNGDLLTAENLLGRKVSLSKIHAGQIKPGNYLVRIFHNHDNSFSEEIITIKEGENFESEKPSIITFLKAME